MKSQLRFLGAMIFCAIIFMACGGTKVKQFTIKLSYPDGTSENIKMTAGNLLHVRHGENYFVAKAGDGPDSTLVLEVSRYGTTRDSIRNQNAIKRMSGSTIELARKKNTLLDPAGGVSVEVTSMTMIDTGRRPKGACLGICCEATCFSTICCADPDECKTAPCDCKPTTNCPGPDTGPQPARFFEVYRSGKDILVLK